MATFGTNHLEPGWDNERLVVHELAHQWFGNAVTAAQLRDIWLHEGFACYTEWLWSERRGWRPRTSGPATTGRSWPPRTSLPSPTRGVPTPSTTGSQARRLTLHALRAALGDEAFFTLCRDWVTTFSGGNVSTADFIALAGRHTAVDLGPLFTAWLDEVDLPAPPA